MSETVINLVLWVPFGLVCLISGVLFLIAGYRRGVLNALVSLGGTVAAAAVSLGIGKLVAIPLAPVVMKLLPAMDENPLGATLEALVQSAAAMVVAMVLFMVLMLILTPVCKFLLKRFVRLPAGGKKMKWGGLGVRLVDAVLFASLLLCPIYGTLYNYLPAADAVMQMQQEQDEDTAVVLSAVQKHPAVKLAGFGPADWVYKGLSQLSTEAVSVNATTLTSTVRDMAQLMGDVSEGADSATATKKLLTYARDNLLEEKWCSQLIVNVGTDYLKQQVAQSGGDSTLLSDALSNLTITPEQFQRDGKDILNLAIGVMDLQSGETTDGEKAAELIQQFSDMLSNNETIKQLKEQVYTTAITQLTGDSSQETVDKIRDSLNTVELTQEQKLQETGALLQLLGGGDKESALEALTELGVLSRDLLP